jgi:hypothetical protein
MFRSVGLKLEIPDPGQSAAMSTAKGAVRDAKRTLHSTEETCEEVKRSEDEEGR